MKSSEFVEQIEQVLKEKGIKKGDFYKACGISSANMSLWRYDKHYPLLETVNRVNEYLGTTLKFTMAENEKPAPTDGGGLDAELLKRLMSLTPEEIDMVDAFVQGILAARSK